VREARGEYVWLAESDDYADPQLLEELVTRLEAHPGAGIAYCQSWQVDENDRKLGTMLWWTNRFHSERWQSDYVEHGLTECRRYFLHTCVIPNASATVIRRSCYLQAGGADETYRMVGDWCTYARILLISDVVYCHRPLNYFRCHSHSVRTSSTKSGVHVEEVCRVVDELLGRLDVLPAERREACDRLIGLWLTALLRDRIPLDRSLNVYRHLRKIQPDVHWRIFAKPLSALRKRLSPMPAFN